MVERDRVLATLRFRRPGVVRVEYHPSPAGMYEHDERLRDQMRAHGHDFGTQDALIETVAELRRNAR